MLIRRLFIDGSLIERFLALDTAVCLRCQNGDGVTLESVKRSERRENGDDEEE